MGETIEATAVELADMFGGGSEVVSVNDGGVEAVAKTNFFCFRPSG